MYVRHRKAPNGLAVHSQKQSKEGIAMNYARRLLAMFLPCLLATFSLAALGAAPAQAAGNWLLEGKSIEETMEVQGENDSSVYAFLVPSLNIELVFESFSIDNGVLSPGGEGTAELLFTKGKLYTTSPTLQLVKNCIVGDLNFKVKINLFLHSGATYALVTPAEGTTLTITTYKECPLSPKNVVTGSMVLEDPSSFEQGLVKHLVQQAPAALFPGDTMLFGVNSMSLDGSWWMSLKGKNEGLKWSGVG
jgi:hypothetical protein